MASQTPTKAQKTDMTTTGRKDLLSKMQEYFNDTTTNSFVEMIPNSEKNPKFYDIKLKINGQDSRHLCKVIVTDSKTLAPFSMGDVIMSTEISNKQEEGNVAFSLIHEKVSEIPYLKGLFDQFGRLYKRTTWYDGYHTRTMETANTPAPAMPNGDKVTELETEIARMKPFHEYAVKVLGIDRPPQ